MNKIAKTRLEKWLKDNQKKKYTHLYMMIEDLLENNKAFYNVSYRKRLVSHYHELTKCLHLLGICNYSCSCDYNVAPRGGQKGYYICIN